MGYVASAELLNRGTSRLLVIDIQERFVPVISGAPRLISVASKLIRGARVFGIPVFATEQYTKGLGPTVSQLSQLVPDRVEKMRFSSVEALDWGPAAEQSDQRFQVVLTGIESHVCVLQTCLDLLSLGYQVHVPADGVASRRDSDWKFALDRMSNSGATITTAESILFEWCEVSGTPEFKQISALVKEP